MAKTLDVYFHDDLAGRLTQDDGGAIAFEYTDSWLNRPVAVPLSQSLPLEKKRYNRKACRAFFSGILPEDAKREIIARNLGISARNDYAMLERIGGECAGAVTFLPSGQPLPERNYGYRKLTGKELADIIRELPRRPLLAGEEGVRLSLAGAQDKVAVRIEDGEICLPLGGAPSTHILKPALDRFDGVVFNEALCMKLAIQCELPAAAVETRNVDGIDYLLVERYDRIHAQGSKPTVKRLHQEDFCQALGIVSEQKYQKEGGPSLKQCFALVRQVSSAPAIDLARLLDAVIFNYLIGNNDAHGKNFSLLYRGSSESSEVRLAPLYDLVCTACYPELSPEMAMKIGGEYSPQKVARKNFEQLAEEAGFGKPLAVARVPVVADRVLTGLSQLKITHSIVEKIATLIRERAERARKFA